MQIRTIKLSDAERIYDLFRSAAVTREDLQRGVVPHSGFFEYPISERDLTAKLQEPQLSLMLEDGQRILAYIIAYDVNAIKNRLLPAGVNDPVLVAMQNSNPRMVYVDQLYMRPNMPAFVAGRLFDAWERIVQGERIPGAAGVVPQKPWRNETSTRFSLHRGFRRSGTVRDGSIEFGLFTKPYWEKDVLITADDLS